MKILPLTIIIILIFGSSLPAWASVELNAYLPISGDPVTPQFKFSKTVTITYPTGGKLKTLLDGQNKTVSFTADSDHDPQVDTLRRDINLQLENGTQSITKITHLRLDYLATVSGGPYSTNIEYSITLIPTLTNYVISQGTDDNATILDASWIAFEEKRPVTISTQKYGDLEINYLADFVKSQLPEAYDIIQGTLAETTLQQSLIDSSQILRLNPLDRWDRLFDPAYTLTQTAFGGQIGEKVAVTTFATGLSSLGGEAKIRHEGTDFSSDASYNLDVSEGPDAATINVQGHANQYNLQGKWAFATKLMVVSTTLGGPIPWFVQVNGWFWVGVGIVGVIGFWIFYFKWFRD